MVAYAPLRYWREGAAQYTKKWREYLVQQNPGIEWSYWLKSDPWRDMPFVYASYFCTSYSHRGFWGHSVQFNHMACIDCGKLHPKLWPLFIFECDECEQIFMAKFPVRYHLCNDCGG